MLFLSSQWRRIIHFNTQKTDSLSLIARIVCICLLFPSVQSLYGQDDTSIQEGTVSFVTSNSIYVKFDDTEKIQSKDTLLSQKGGVLVPCMVVVDKSSTSCVCRLLDDCQVEQGQTIVFSYSAPKKRTSEGVAVPDSTQIEINESTSGEVAASSEVITTEPSFYKEKIRGRISASSYSNFSQNYGDQHRTMMRMSLRAEHLNQSAWSFESYLNYRQNFESNPEGENQSEGLFRVYNLALTYDVDTSLSLSFGRKINRRASSLGAIDGLQAEKQFGSGTFYTGAIMGFRPDYYDYSFNPDLFEYGAYVGMQKRKSAFYSSTTFVLLEQQNSGAIDRRYIYVQHNSIIDRSIYLFASMETDLFKRINGSNSFDPRLTNLYLSARYRFSRKLDLTLSYDARRHIIYYETFKTQIERLLEDDLARQGARTRVNYRPIKYLSIGISYSKRFQNDQHNASDNINGYISHSNMPLIDGRLSARFNWNRSTYLESRILSFRYSRTIIRRTLDADAYVRLVQYEYASSGMSFDQQYYGLSLNYRIGRLWMFSMLYELSNRSTEQKQRINTKIIRRLGYK